MNIPLTSDLRALIQEAIAAGRLHTEEDAVQEALALWAERERRRLEILASVDEAEASLAAGKGRVVNTREEAEQLTQDVAKRGRTRLAAEQNTGR